MASAVHGYDRAVGTAENDDLNAFYRQIRERSREHQEAMTVATERGWRSIAIGILRQELDSMIRVVFLLAQPSTVRADLVSSSVAGERWRTATGNGKMKAVTDRDMVELADRLHGWTRNVYEFGCKFIHLSSAHDYLACDPFQALPVEDKEVIARHLHQYHSLPGKQITASSTFDDIIDYAPSVLKKISSNLEWDLKTLQGESCV
ncbi:hypothetical protein [Streptomyces sp. NPDC000618]|uniref:hypothetical protein n=1 Tax=Streptomyces sp. NPDC000618 TaxID=3154265 RepID=UPI003318C3C0